VLLAEISQDFIVIFEKKNSRVEAALTKYHVVNEIKSQGQLKVTETWVPISSNLQFLNVRV
jgi:hypothetical protein